MKYFKIKLFFLNIFLQNYRGFLPRMLKKIFTGCFVWSLYEHLKLGEKSDNS
jgi:hypothetical protein